jgi:hypothetical protein
MLPQLIVLCLHFQNIQECKTEIIFVAKTFRGEGQTSDVDDTAFKIFPGSKALHQT